MMKHLLPLLLVTCICAACLFTGCTEEQPNETAKPTSPIETKNKPDGLTIENGKLIKGGEEFHGVGVNYFSMFTGIFTNKWNLSEVFQALEELKNYDCKVIRFSTLPFYAKDMGFYMEVEDTYWAKMDELIEKCEELDIGLIPSMFWTFSFFDYYNEPYVEAIFDDNSQGMLFMKEYTYKFVKRYAESPAIYGWEFSNEKILSSDIPGQELSDTYISTDALNHIYTVWADIVAENDPYDRIIATGDTNPRESQYNQWKLGTWNKDTWEQHMEVLATINPGKINTVSQHQYSLSSLNPGDKTAPLFEANNWNSFFRYLIDASASLGKPCYVGEAGFTCAAELGRENVTEETLQEVYDSIGAAILDTDMQLVLLWNYDHESSEQNGAVYGHGGGTEFSWNGKMRWGRIALSMMKEVNQQLDGED